MGKRGRRSEWREHMARELTPIVLGILSSNLLFALITGKWQQVAIVGLLTIVLVVVVWLFATQPGRVKKEQKP